MARLRSFETSNKSWPSVTGEEQEVDLERQRREWTELLTVAQEEPR